MLIELSAKLIAEQMPACREVMDIVAARFNEVTSYRWGRIIDFPEAALCADAKNGQPVLERQHRSRHRSGALKDLLRLWKYRAPWFFDEFDRLEEVFPAASYQYVLYGMGFRTEVDPAENAEHGHDGVEAAKRERRRHATDAIAIAQEPRASAEDL